MLMCTFSILTTKCSLVQSCPCSTWRPNSTILLPFHLITNLFSQTSSFPVSTFLMTFYLQASTLLSSHHVIFLDYILPTIDRATKYHSAFYSKTNQKHNISNLFYFGTKLYMFRTVYPSIIRSLRLYIQNQVYVIQVLWLLTSGTEMELPFHLVPASKQPRNLYDIDAVCTVLDCWWWTERPSETCRVLFQNKINLRYCTSGWFYYRNILRCTVLQTSNSRCVHNKQ
jgi:hypothetical protein